MSTTTHSELALFGGEPTVPNGTVKPWPEVTEEDKQAVMAVLDRGVFWGAHAPEITALQEDWAQWLGAKYCLATNSGTAALHMAVAAAGVEPGDEVITTPFSGHPRPPVYCITTPSPSLPISIHFPITLTRSKSKKRLPPSQRRSYRFTYTGCPPTWIRSWKSPNDITWS